MRRGRAANTVLGSALTLALVTSALVLAPAKAASAAPIDPGSCIDAVQDETNELTVTFRYFPERPGCLDPGRVPSDCVGAGIGNDACVVFWTPDDPAYGGFARGFPPTYEFTHTYSAPGQYEPSGVYSLGLGRATGFIELGPPDTDGDGLVDTEDDCPEEPGTEAAGGCPLHLGIINESGDMVDATVTGDPCGGSLTLTSADGNDLWVLAEVEAGAPAERTGANRYLNGLVPTGGRTSASWEVCLDAPNQSIRWEITSDSWRANWAQFAEIAAAATPFGAASTLNDLEAIVRALDALPTKLRNATERCFHGTKTQARVCMAKLVILSPIAFGRWVLELFGQSFVWQETVAVLSSVDAPKILKHFGLWFTGGATVPGLTGPVEHNLKADLKDLRTKRKVQESKRALVTKERRQAKKLAAAAEDEVTAARASRRLAKADVSNVQTELNDCQRNGCSKKQMKRLYKQRKDAKAVSKAAKKQVNKAEKALEDASKTLQKLTKKREHISKKISKLKIRSKNVSRLIKRGLPMIGALVQAGETLKAKLRRGGDTTGVVYVVTCLPSDRRKACTS